jgi:uncharacterized protein (UPF0332 family)
MNQEERNLLDKAQENIKASELLLGKGFEEISASRAYYAMFYLAEALLLSRGMSFSSHAAVIAAFGKEFSKTGLLDPIFHLHLIKSQELRQSGDYGSISNVSAESASKMIAWASEFYSVTEKFLTQENQI